MKAGDKVRFKGDHPMVSKGALGNITYVDWLTDIITIKFDDNITVTCTPDEFKDFIDIILDSSIECPAVLKNWFKQTEKYIGRKDD